MAMNKIWNTATISAVSFFAFPSNAQDARNLYAAGEHRCDRDTIDIISLTFNVYDPSSMQRVLLGATEVHTGIEIPFCNRSCNPLQFGVSREFSAAVSESYGISQSVNRAVATKAAASFLTIASTDISSTVQEGFTYTRTYSQTISSGGGPRGVGGSVSLPRAASGSVF
jgi:hypothetical protein